MLGGTLSYAWLAVSLVLAGLLAGHGLRKRSLSRSGAAAAFVVGAIHFNCGFRYGIVLIMFYLSSSKLTKLNQARKAEIEEDFKKDGQRTWVQVLCNSAGAALAALLIHAREVLLSGSSSSMGETHQLRGLLTSDDPIQTCLLAGFLGHYACCCADTWASELGVLSPEPPRLITTLKVVPAGTNGAVSLRGLLASAAGGLFIGLVFWASGPDPLGAPGQWLAVPLGLVAGLFGSLVDSLLGATLQFSGICESTRRVVAAPREGVKRICGRDLLDNHAVNALSAALTLVFSAALGRILFS